jgi:serine/threonine protein kinase
LANRLEQAWQATAAQQPPPDLAAFLPPPGDFLRLAALQELVRVDLAIRWRRGMPTFLDFYVERFSELGGDAALPVELICQEYRLRRQHGQHPSLDDYQARFPSQYPHLLGLVREVEDRAGADADVSDLSGTSPPTLLPGASDAADSVVVELKTYPQNTPRPTPPAPVTKQMEVPPPPAEPSGEHKNVVPMVGGYRLLKRLGSGALGEVWKAEAPGGVEVAVKRLSRTLEAHEAQYELRSLEHVKKLRHNYLMPIHAYWVHKSRLYVAMELGDGSLCDRAEDYQKQGQPGIPRDELIRYMREAAEALDFLHSEGVHHRDIKPANILLLKGHVKVADFGLVRPLRDMDSMVNATFCGTPTYMPPEAWDNKISIHSDQWSLAISYLELRLNRRVFKSRTIPSLMVEIRNSQVDLSPLEPAEQRVIKKALHPNPRQRYANCTAFAQALEAVFRPAAPPPPRRWLTVAVALLASLAASGLLVSLFLLFWGPRPPSSPSIPPIVTPRIVSEEIPSVEVDTGRTKTLKIPIRREHFVGKVQLVPKDELQKVQIQAEAPEGENFVNVSIHVNEAAKRETNWVYLKAQNDELDVKIKLELTILYLPPHFEAMGTDTDEDDSGVKYYKRIRRPLNEKTAVEFVLIPLKQKDLRTDAPIKYLRTFYISRFKISREQFQFFAEQSLKKVKDDKWKNHADDGHMPVREVTVTDAHAFAEWLGGWLPSRAEWDKAAGRYHPARGEGPYIGRWKDKKRPRIAIGLEKPLVMDSDATKDDESVYGCRDMAGNGSEWTRTTSIKDKDVPLPVQEVFGDEYVYLRGKSFKESNPLTFESLEYDESQKHFPTEDYKKTAFYIGFRVVLEPNR